MTIIEFNNGVWIEYPNDFDGPILVYDNTKFISVEQYCASFGIKADNVKVHNDRLLIISARPIPFNKIAELTNWDKITIEPGYNAFIVSININDNETDNSNVNPDA